MGNYNTQYQSYYNNLAKRQGSTNNFAGESNRQGGIWNFYIKRLTRELIGVLTLFIIVLLCKVVVTTKTQYVYNYSKEIINKKYDYSILIDKAKGFKIKDIEIITVNFMEKIKSAISNENELNNKNIGL
ncbi:endopeptidase [Clostridium sp. FP2]|uniref:endopeptidase n=1 Tax=Clostridium TaxID=1485 RepID=UPI0013E94F2D|nr:MULTISPECIES: endopeptidase [Clostridium]MBW9155091.1 endopeptidase [Clostridium tagluense]MBZ9624703.1 endopeptidase [Clostridium sp. FP2]WLC64534.1 endopeptidase [Clostridium tagluense]